MTTTIHAPSAHNPNRAACDGFRANGYKAISADLTKVNCTRCAKKLGITAAPKAESKNRTGTCQCCFASQKVSKGGGKLMSLHGYERPGHGYILGRCRGEEQVPYEVSCEKTKEFQAELRTIKAGYEADLAKLNANEVESIGTFVGTGKTNPITYKEEKTLVTVARGSGETPHPLFPDQPWKNVPSFEKLRKEQIVKAQRAISAISTDIAVLGEKISTWVKVWES